MVMATPVHNCNVLGGVWTLHLHQCTARPTWLYSCLQTESPFKPWGSGKLVAQLVKNVTWWYIDSLQSCNLYKFPQDQTFIWPGCTQKLTVICHSTNPWLYHSRAGTLNLSAAAQNGMWPSSTNQNHARQGNPWEFFSGKRWPIIADDMGAADNTLPELC